MEIIALRVNSNTAKGTDTLKPNYGKCPGWKVTWETMKDVLLQQIKMVESEVYCYGLPETSVLPSGILKKFCKQPTHYYNTTPERAEIIYFLTLAFLFGVNFHYSCDYHLKQVLRNC